jgi:hypothetical protein
MRKIDRAHDRNTSIYLQWGVGRRGGDKAINGQVWKRSFYLIKSIAEAH